MFHSAEVRWFFRGVLPDAAVEWLGDAHAEAGRCDRYFVLPGCTCVGIKERQGSFEVKVICGAAWNLAPREGVSGVAGRWVKWGDPIDEGAGSAGVLSGGPVTQLDVTKERRQRLFDFELAGAAESDVSRSSPRVSSVDTEASQFLPQGCAVEVTALDLAGDAWWTVALEAFGQPDTLSALLDVAAGHVFSTRAFPLPLDTPSSKSYPAWLDERL